MKRLISICAATLTGVVAAADTLTLGFPFADNMVLQREMPVRIWGWAAPKATVAIAFADQRATGTADTNGFWRIDLKPLSASSEGRPLTVTSQTSQTSLTNIVVGEVWFASGQSNMEMALAGSEVRYRDEQGRLVTQWTRRPNVRFARNPAITNLKPQMRRGERAKWLAVAPENAHRSALAWYYALELHAALNVPIGVVEAAWGGSRIQPFIPREGFAAAGLDVTKEKDPASKWNAMINPWIPMAMRGFIWYQGCSNAGEWKRYDRLMDALYRGWSGAFENPKLHLNFVQLAPWGWAGIADMQEAQDRFAKREPNATMAVVCDRGNIGDIHPADKETVAKRLVALALKHNYGFNIKAASPGIRAARASGDLVEVTFDDAALIYDYPDKNGNLCKDFELAGDDGQFQRAEIVNYRPYVNLRGERRLMVGELIGTNVYLRAKGVAEPKFIRYLHASPWDGSLFNEVGLPLKPFSGEVAQWNDKVRIEWDIALMEKRNAAIEAMFGTETSILKFKDKVRSVKGTNIWTDAINAALKKAQCVRIPASREPYYVDGTLIVPANRKILAKGATIRLLAPCDTVLMRNAGAADGTAAPVNRAKGDKNIFILGGRWEDWQTKRAGYGKSGRFNDGPREKGKNFYGVSSLFYFGNLTTLTLRNLTLAHCGGFAIQCGDATDVIVENVEFDHCFADGFHCNGNVRNVLARNIRGDVGDDLVALNFYDWQDSSVNFGPGDTVLCEKLRLRSGYPAIRLLPAVYRYADGTKVDCALRNILLRDVKGVNCFKMYLQTPNYAIGTPHEWGEVGSAENLWFENIDVDLTSPPDGFDVYKHSDPVRGHFGCFEIGANVKGLHLSNMTVNLHAEKYPLAHLISVGPKSAVHVPATGAKREIFDPWVSCKAADITLNTITYVGKPPAEEVHATVFDDINKDGVSSGRGEVAPVRHTRELFNGKNLTGWYKFLRGRGKNNDPKGVIAVRDGKICISGEEFGALVTEEEFADYRLDVEYRFTGTRFASKMKKALDSGILFHSTGPDGGFDGTWLFSHEYNLITGASGDIWTVGDSKTRPDMVVVGEAGDTFDDVSMPAGPYRTFPIWKRGGRKVELRGNRRLCRFDIDPSWTDTPAAQPAVNEAPTGDWNTATLICRGDQVECWFNGKLVNAATRVVPARGKIQLQSEGCGVEFRRISITQ